jgi:DNA-binding NtrC family response regulator
VLDSGEIRPVGGNSSIRVDVRLIAATNKNIEAGVKDGWFREDLFYRLNVFTITLPPLRNRMESLKDLVDLFLDRASKRVNKTIMGIEDRALHSMHQYHWPGNIRELQNIIERAAVLTQDSIIRLENLPVIFAELAMQESGGEAASGENDFQSQRNRHLSQIEKSLLKRYLKESEGNVSEAARQAKVPRRTFYRLLTRYGIKGADFNNEASQ